MLLKGFNNVISKSKTRLQICTVITLAVITTGCAVSEKTASSNYILAAPANRQIVPDTADIQQSDDEDFDLLEEDITEKKIEIPDPLEGLNRIMFGINDALYFWLVKPCAQTYEKVVPQPVRLGVRNFFQNVSTPVRFVNCHLQGKTAAADTELNRFLINTTAGILGFGDPAQDQYGLAPVDEDLGQTLATFGFGNGFYLVLPLLGPSTLRDSVGFAGDAFLKPTFYIEPTETAIAVSAVKYTNESSFHIGEYETFKSAAVDAYVALRQAYIQYRQKQIQQ